jgi:hypothetical protein
MSELSTTPDIHDIATGCLDLLRSASSAEFLDSPERLPAAIRSKHPRWVFVDPTTRSVLIEFGGGFFHYGYRFEPVEAGGEQWRLLLHGEKPAGVRELLRL